MAGIALIAVSAAIFSWAGMFTRSVTAAAWVIIFWRGRSGVHTGEFDPGGKYGRGNGFGRGSDIHSLSLAAETAPPPAVA